MESKIITLRLVKTNEDMEHTLDIRRKVFVEEQCVPEAEEFDGNEEEAYHFIAFYGKNPAGCARIRSNGEQAKIERLAVRYKYRNRGVGSSLMRFMLDHLINRSAGSVHLHSQVKATGFYSRFGFFQRGDKFMDAGIEHVDMVLSSDEPID